MQQLPGALARQLQLPVGRLLGLLDERVNNHDTPSQNEAVERSANSRLAPRAQLKQSLAERSGMRKPQVRTMFREQFDQSRVVGNDINRPRLDLSQDTFVEVLNLERHSQG
jgi:hypothetical protein